MWKWLVILKYKKKEKKYSYWVTVRFHQKLWYTGHNVGEFCAFAFGMWFMATSCSIYYHFSVCF